LARVLLVVALLVSAFVMPARAAACLDVEASPPGLSVTREGFDTLSLLFVEPLPAGLLLDAAGDGIESLLMERGRTPVPHPGEEAYTGTTSANWQTFSEYYCQAWEMHPDGVTPSDLAYAGIRSMVDAVDEAHTVFMTPQIHQNHQQWAQGNAQYEGIGARLRSDPLRVVYVFPGSPAEAAGIRRGDELLAVNGETVRDESATNVALMVRGEAGTSVRLTVARQGDPVRDIEIVRASIRIQSLEARVIGDVGYLRIQDFPVPALYDDVAAELTKFNQMGVKGLILDLRANTGGRTDVGARVAGLFLNEGTPVYQRTTRRGQAATQVAPDTGIRWNKPIVALIDGGTASMGEILAAALQEQGIARMVGETTAGVVAGAIVVPLSDGAAIQVTTVRIDSGLGRVLNNIGVEPDIPVEETADSLRTGADVQLDSALGVLRAEIRAAENAPRSALPRGMAVELAS
jgi:carboxyl-terminal processing protease